jgi:hypothetical protein
MFPNYFATGTGCVPVQRQMEVNGLENNENTRYFHRGICIYLCIHSFIHSWLLEFRPSVIERGIFLGGKMRLMRLETPYLLYEYFAIHLFPVRSQNCEKRLLASSCLSVRMEQFGSQWTDYHEM